MRARIIAVVTAALVFSGALAGAAWAPPDPNGPAKKGLCNAYFRGSENGQEHKRKAGPFAGLEAAAEANDQTVEEFCFGDG